jgi:hypothetical protein
MAGLFDKKIVGMPEASQSAQSTYWGKENIKFESLGMPPRLSGGKGAGCRQTARKQTRKTGPCGYMGCGLQGRSQRQSNALTPGAFGGLFATDIDRKNILKGLSMMAEAMLLAGAKEVWPSVYGASEAITSIAEARKIADLKPGPGIVPMAATHLFCGVNVREKISGGGHRWFSDCRLVFLPFQYWRKPHDRYNDSRSFGG